MIDLRKAGPGWHHTLAPRFTGNVAIGEGIMEPFVAWWARNGAGLEHLDPCVLEQWVQRHFFRTAFKLPLADLTSRREIWPTERIIAEVITVDGSEPERDYAFLSATWGRAMAAKGTWDCPLLVLATPDGFKDQESLFPDARYALIEGHRRRRMLMALEHRGEALPAHEVLVLTLNAATPGAP